MNTYWAVLLALITFRALEWAVPLFKPLLKRFEWRDYRLLLWDSEMKKGRFVFDLRSKQSRDKINQAYYDGIRF